MDATVRAPFEAVAIRYVHDARTQEFLNIGVVLLAVGHRFAGARFLPQWGRVTAAFPGADLVMLRRIARAFERRCTEWSAEANGQQSLQPIANIAELARTVMLPDDASIQLSPLIAGVTANSERILRELFELYAGGSLEREERASREDGDVWRDFAVTKVANPWMLKRLQRHVLQVPHYEIAFDNAWKNGAWNAAQPISLDLLEPRTIRDKATTWTGKILTVRPSQLETKLFLLVGLPSGDSPTAVRVAANDALAILQEQLEHEAEIITEPEADRLASKIAHDLTAHADDEM